MKNLYKIILSIGPGIFAIGYTIGTGSVTSMIVAGSKHGMQLLWVLLLSCFFSWVLMEAYGRYALVTGQTALYGFRKNLKYGKAISILIIIGITVGQWNSLIGILGISANAIFETLSLFFPALKDNQYLAVLLIAIIIIAIMYFLLLKGSYTIFEKVLIFFVTLMGLSFVMSFFMVLPNPGDIVKGLVPSIPQVKGGKMLVAAFVGKTMASATFLSRPLFLQGKGWNKDNLMDQKKDALIAAILIFCISGAIMAVAMGAFFDKGIGVTKVLDMVNTLEPVAGKMAVGVFLLGTLSAGLSSIFPILMIAPMLIADYQSGVLDTKSTQFKILTFVACVIGLMVPIFGANPINAQILSQVFNVFVLPLVILGIYLQVNNERLMGTNKAGLALNAGIIGAFIFSILISYNGVIGIINNFSN
ncbi:MAG: Nramp family divalent metal transporter [Cyclobacteriaceae bacterium]